MINDGNAVAMPPAGQTTLLLGLGNLLRRDEGLGIRALELLEQRYQLPESVQIVDGGTLGLELLSYLEGVARVIVLDATLTEGPPGTLICLRGDEVPAFLGMHSSPHEIGLPDLLAVARLRGTAPAEIALFGMQPEVIELGWELSPRVAEELYTMVDAVIGELRSLGLPAIPRYPPAVEAQPE